MPIQASHSRSRRGFTLIELLIVVMIIAVLSSALVGAIFFVKERALRLRTQKRIQDVTVQIGEYGINNGGPSFVFTRKLGLTLAKPTFEVEDPMPTPQEFMERQLDAIFTDTAYTDSVLADISTLGDAVDRSNPSGVGDVAGIEPGDFVLNNPWGKPRMLDDTGTPNYDTTASGDVVLDLDDIEPVTIREMNPLLAFYFLWQAGILPPDDTSTSTEHESLTAYLQDRHDSRPWNDSWGHPIVISYLIFEPKDKAWDRQEDDQGLAMADDPQWGMMELWAKARKLYGKERILYLSAGAAGPVIYGGRPGDVNDWPKKVWDHVLYVTSEGDASDPVWDEGSFADPPFEGLHYTQFENYQCYIHSPYELK